MPLSYQWQRNNTNISGATSSSYTLPSAAASDNGSSFRCILTNSVGSVTSNAAILTVTGNAAPTPTIVTPAAGTRYTAGTTLNFSGTATDPEDGTLPASRFMWQIDFHHDAHAHPGLPPTSDITSGSYIIPNVGETSANVWYRVYLTVVDSAGQSVSDLPRPPARDRADHADDESERLWLDARRRTDYDAVYVHRCRGRPSPDRRAVPTDTTERLVRLPVMVGRRRADAHHRHTIRHYDLERNLRKGRR